MAKPFITWKLTEDSKDYFFYSRENHYGNGAVTAANTGVTLATEEEAKKYPRVSVEELLRSDQSVRRKLHVTSGSGATLKHHYPEFVVATSKVDTFEALNAGNYTLGNGQAGSIKGVVEPLKATYY